MCRKIPDFCSRSTVERWTPRLVNRLTQLWQAAHSTPIGRIHAIAELNRIRDIMLDTHTKYKSVVEDLDFLAHLANHLED